MLSSSKLDRAAIPSEGSMPSEGMKGLSSNGSGQLLDFEVITIG